MRQNRWLVLAIALIALVFLTLDWSRLVLRPADLSLRPESNALKVSVAFLCALIAWRARGRGLGERDERTFRLVFSMIFVADVCFVTKLEPVGIVLFGIVQVLLTRRNLTGARAAAERLRAARGRLVAVGAIVAAMLAGTLYGIWVLQGLSPLLVVIAVYVSLLAASVVAAFAARSIGHFPARNTRLFAIGMSLFLLCDITVGANLALPVGHLVRVATESLTWMFYGPAILLLALSAWRGDEKQASEQAAPAVA